MLREFYPNGVRPENYADLLFIVRILDKLMRIANDKGAFNEDPIKDIAGSGLLATIQAAEIKKALKKVESDLHKDCKPRKKYEDDTI